ncbi:hypothetical protein [Corynebacterium guangdongense]|uniref:ABC-type Zn2+ transport system substrate-binding protein/surface adhesin n=1 Tax=Corynebacterium guangdongense TaxID=1783348 RepID=A0ABU2A0D1_9CORY|nr:hypothetical protein [Corynebacterium guangdongense]MDR7330611.1 ABC-type Zn2+ transport system substrate-binding protein/surface adhesin [Corynebacterium guangdongense]WJZ16628.1 hypothetical protein CGUA_00080 [Corynebacterium guangdongense]
MKKLTVAAVAAVATASLAAPAVANAQYIHQPAPLHSVSTGSSALDSTIGVGVIAAVTKLVIDNVQPLSDLVEEIATGIGSSQLVGSSGVSFNLESLSA